MKTEERAAFILKQLNVGLRTEWSQIEGIEAGLEKKLHEAKDRADQHVPAEKRAMWEKDWELVHEKLADLREHASSARELYNQLGASAAIDSWSHINVTDTSFDHLLDRLRREGREALPGIHMDPWYDSWKELWREIEGDLTTLRLHIVVTRFQLEMRRDQGQEKADKLTREILERLPEGASVEDAERFANEYRLAHYELEDHREHPTWRDIFKGLLMYPEETPDDVLFHKQQTEAP